ncbi:Small GTPase superfamily [Carpediemonas membranifera]|uniref:Small GTPase superfamily n=1 Tax=Carpediemonas membranifera TaxID=201153 RepID=A0A8J6AY66_9EUKA|nr:Small GTPase superfamily [Carpediemonas membranifera]|eukprot:KAG9396988.1 Small GTPase superfamily [Carpediemonas membranifera]
MLDSEATFKYIVLGEYNSGKTAMVDALQDKPVSRRYTFTIGANMAVLQRTVSNHAIGIRLWDIAGTLNDLFLRYHPAYFRNSHAAIVAVSLAPDEQQDLDEVARLVDIIRERTRLDGKGGAIPVFVVGTKADLAEGSARSEAYDVALRERLADLHVSGYFTTTAFERETVDKALGVINEIVYNHYALLGQVSCEPIRRPRRPIIKEVQPARRESVCLRKGRRTKPVKRREMPGRIARSWY